MFSVSASSPSLRLLAEVYLIHQAQGLLRVTSALNDHSRKRLASVGGGCWLEPITRRPLTSRLQGIGGETFVK